MQEEKNTETDDVRQKERTMGRKNIVPYGLYVCYGFISANLAKQTGFYQADRLARTELCYIQNQATYDKFQEAGIKEYTVLDTSDDRCCADCQDKANKVYKLSEAQVGVNYPPFHSNCRCAVLAIIN